MYMKQWGEHMVLSTALFACQVSEASPAVFRCWYNRHSQRGMQHSDIIYHWLYKYDCFRILKCCNSCCFLCFRVESLMPKHYLDIAIMVEWSTLLLRTLRRHCSFMKWSVCTAFTPSLSSPFFAHYFFVSFPYSTCLFHCLNAWKRL